MKIKYPERVRARRTIADLTRQYVDTLMRQFRAPPEELLQRVEARLESEKPPDQIQPNRTPG